MKQFFSFLKQHLYLIVLILFLFTLARLPSVNLSSNLDDSWKTVLLFAQEQQYKFGSQIIFTYGPLGFLATESYLSQDSKVISIVLNIILYGFASCIFVSLLKTIKLKSHQTLYFILMMYVTTLATQDLVHSIIFTLTTFWLLRTDFRKNIDWLVVFAIVITQAMLLLTKGSFVVLVPLIIVSLMVKLFDAGKRNLAYFYALFFATLVLLVWLGLGQNLKDLPQYFGYSMSLSAGYTTAMSIRESNQILVLIVIQLVLISGVLFWFTYKNKRKTPVILFTILLVNLFLIFQHWKHGIVRADQSHVLILIMFALLYWINSVFFFFEKLKLSKKALIIFGFFLITLFSIRTIGLQFNYSPYAILNRIDLNVRALFQDEVVTTKQNPFPELSLVLNKSTLDIFGFNQALFIGGQFNYQPRPIFQSYSVYDQKLLVANEKYIAQAGPEYYLLYMETVDNHLPLFDDFPAILQLIKNYELVSTNQNYLVFKKSEPKNLVISTVKSGQLRFGETMMLDQDGHGLILELNFDRTAIGKLLNILYKNSNINLEITKSDGSLETRKITADVSKFGFLISPSISTTEDLSNWLNGSSVIPVKSVKLTLESKLGGYADTIDFDLKKVNF